MWGWRLVRSLFEAFGGRKFDDGIAVFEEMARVGARVGMEFASANGGDEGDFGYR